MSLDQALTTVEHHLEKVSEALLCADSDALQASSQQLRDASVAFAQMLDALPVGTPLSAAMHQRMNAVSATLSIQRDSIAKVNAVTDRQVATLVPSSNASPTYGSSMGGRAQGQGAAARIYRTAG